MRLRKGGATKNKTISRGWVPVARESFEYNMRPWGRRHERWLRDSVRPHPIDPGGQVLVPEQLYEVFKKRTIFSRITAKELAAAGYPKLPRDPVARAASQVLDADPIVQATASRSHSPAMLRTAVA
jgi:hypothetical protein